MGEFNLLECDFDILTLINNHDLCNLIKKPTCFKSTSGRCIDLMLTNKKFNFMNTQTFETGFSDFHVMLYTMLKSTYQKLQPQIIRYRQLKNICHEAFASDLKLNLTLNGCVGDFDSFETIFQQVLDIHAPCKTKVARANNKPYVNKQLRKEISIRAHLKNIANKTGDISDLLKYKKQRNYVSGLNGRLKKKYLKNLDLKQIETNRSFWKIFKPMFSTKYSPAEKITLIENDNIITDDETLVEIFNEYFSNITNSLDIFSWATPEILLAEDEISYAIRKYNNHPSIIKLKSLHKADSKFEFTHVLPETVLSYINKLNPRKMSSGGISTSIIKEFSDIYCVEFTDCINASINNCLFPSNMKNGELSPIFKKNAKTNKSNFRPITLNTALSKVAERIIYDQLYMFMNVKFSNFLCGFRKGYSTKHALLRLIEDWRKALDSKDIVGSVFCDLSKAFDTLPHDLLIAKLEAYGIGPKALKLLNSYLKGRKQRCKLGSFFSTWRDILMGVPQGSVLGPILFNIFINDLFLFIQECGVCNFADDNSLWSRGKTLDIVINKLEGDTRRTINWLKINSLVANPDKFQFMILGTKKKVNLKLEINGITCVSTSSVNLLGIEIDWKLSFNKHVLNICKQANKKAGALIRIRNHIDESQKLVLYESFIMSTFSYCPLLWMFCGIVADNTINRVQRRALRAVYNDFISEGSGVLKNGNHLSVHERNINFLILEVFKYLNKESPPILNELFQVKDLSYNLRINNLLVLPSVSTQICGTHSIRYRGSTIWNHVPDELKCVNNSLVLKEKLKQFKFSLCTCKICS